MQPVSLVSLMPFKLFEKKPTCRPFEYIIPASVDKKPQVLQIPEAQQSRYVITSGSDEGGRNIWEYIDPGRHAEAIIMDFFTAKEGYVPGEPEEMCAPALFCVPGLVTPDQVMKEFLPQVRQALMQQVRWCEILIRKGDDNWATYKVNRAISDDMRSAVKFMKMTRAWAEARPNEMPETKLCPACSTEVKGFAIICPNCKYVFDETKAKQLKFA